MRISKRAMEWTLFGLVGLVAVLANLPQSWLDFGSINRNLFRVFTESSGQKDG